MAAHLAYLGLLPWIGKKQTLLPIVECRLYDMWLNQFDLKAQNYVLFAWLQIFNDSQKNQAQIL